MRHYTDAEVIAGYVVTALAILICAGAVMGLIGLAWSVVYPLIVMMMAAI